MNVVHFLKLAMGLPEVQKHLENEIGRLKCLLLIKPGLIARSMPFFPIQSFAIGLLQLDPNLLQARSSNLKV
jgi:hypothetical protein